MLLILNGPLKLVFEIGGPNYVQQFILGFGAFHLIQLHVIKQCSPSALGFFEFLRVKFQQLHPTPDGGLREPRLFGNGFYTVPQI